MSDYLRSKYQYGNPTDQGMSLGADNLQDYEMPSSAPLGGGETGSAAAFGAAGPAGAAVGLGGSLLTGYLAQKAADERQRRQNKIQIAQNQADGEIGSFKFLDNVYKGALR